MNDIIPSPPVKRRTVVDDDGVIHYSFGRNLDGGYCYTTLCDEHNALTDMAANLHAPELVVDGKTFEPKRRWNESQLQYGPVTCAICLGLER